MSLQIFKALAMHEQNHDAMLRSGILAYMLNDTASSSQHGTGGQDNMLQVSE